LFQILRKFLEPGRILLRVDRKTRQHPEKHMVGRQMSKRNTASVSVLGALLAILSLAGSSAQAATATGTFNSTITIQANCQVISTNTLNFGTQNILTANTDASATFTVQCTNTTPYNVGLNAGSTAGGTVATRLMTSGAATVSYKMYSDAARTTNWGNTVGTDTLAGTGNGTTQTLTVYGRVPVQTTPAPATYNDTVTVTVTY
jgi:spore coat protein U-like protein